MRAWLKERREQRGWTQAEFARRLGICQSYYGYIEAGTRQKNMGVNLLTRLAAELELSVADILAAESERTRETSE